MSDGVRAADAALFILETVAFSRDPLGVTQIAAEVGISKSAVFKHLHTLVSRGYVVQDPLTARYRLGPKAWLIARLAPATDDLAASAEPLMREARDTTGLAVVISTPTPKGAFVLARLPGTRPIEIGVRPGSQLAFHASAQGKIFLAYGPKSFSDGLLEGELERLTRRTITSHQVLMEEIGRVRMNGYAMAPEETLLGVNSIAAPIYDHADSLVASVALVGSIQHVPASPNPDLIATLQTLAANISHALGNGMMRRRERISSLQTMVAAGGGQPAVNR